MGFVLYEFPDWLAVMISRNGVCYDLQSSPYKYEWRGMVFFFSSESHRSKFIRNLREKELWLDDSLSRRFKCTVHLPILADIQLYTQIETRGFYVQTNDGAEYNMAASIFVEANLQQIGVNYGSL